MGRIARRPRRDCARGSRRGIKKTSRCLTADYGSHANVGEPAMRVSLITLGLLAAAIVSGPPAGAQNYPWCAQYSGGSMGGGRNCGFTTFEQCLATVHGIG